MEQSRPSTSLAASLADRLTRAAEEAYGPERARELAPAIRAAAETLALVAASELPADDAEPDFIAEAPCPSYTT